MFEDLLDQVAGLKSRGEPFVLATVVGCKPPTSAKPGAKAIVRPDGNFQGWVGGSCAQPLVVQESLKVLTDGKPRVMVLAPNPAEVDFGFEDFVPVEMSCQSEGTLAIYLEPFLPKPQLAVIGASPMARSLVSLGKNLGFRVYACDPAASTDLFPDAEGVVQDLSAITAVVGPQGYAVVATMGHYDEEALESVLNDWTRYVGLVASPRRGRAVIDYLAHKGVSADLLQRVKYPAGLDIGAETPEEIAMSILCEIVQRMRAEGRGLVLEPEIQQGAPSSAVDPICQMTVAVAGARYWSTYRAETYYFCCLRCKEEFDKDPDHRRAATNKTP